MDSLTITFILIGIILLIAIVAFIAVQINRSHHHRIEDDSYTSGGISLEEEAEKMREKYHPPNQQR